MQISRRRSHGRVSFAPVTLFSPQRMLCRPREADQSIITTLMDKMAVERPA